MCSTRRPCTPDVRRCLVEASGPIACAQNEVAGFPDALQRSIEEMQTRLVYLKNRPMPAVHSNPLRSDLCLVSRETGQTAFHPQRSYALIAKTLVPANSPSNQSPPTELSLNVEPGRPIHLHLALGWRFRFEADAFHEPCGATPGAGQSWRAVE